MITADQLLITALVQALDSRQPFDAINVVCAIETYPNSELAHIVKAAIPDCCHRSGYRRGRFKRRKMQQLEQLLTKLVPEHLDIGPTGWLYFKSAC
jgi:hypothetical protein